MSRGTRVLAIIALLAPAPGCKSKRKKEATPGEAPASAVSDAGVASEELEPERVVLDRVTVKTVDPEQPREIPARLLAQQLGKQLVDTEWFFAEAEAVPNGFRTRRADLEVLITYDVIRAEKTGLRSIMVAAEAEIRWQGEEVPLPLREKVLFERTLTSEVRGNLEGLFATQVAEAVEAAGIGLIAKEEVRSGPAEKLEKALESSDRDPELALWALEIVREQNRKDMFGRVIALLDAPNRDLREVAVGALIVLGDRRAVEHLAEKVEMGDLDYLRVVIEAVAALGGEEAIAFLEFLASGHPDPDIRQRASEGLAGMRDPPENK